MLHTIQANDVIPILPPAVGWVATATLVYCHVPQGFLGMLSVSHAWWHYNVANWVSHLSDHVVQLGDYPFVGFLLVEAMNLQSFQTLENNISEILCSSRQKYKD